MNLAFLDIFEDYLYTIATGIVILLVGFALGILAKRLIRRLLEEINLNKIIGNLGITYNLEKGASAVISYVIYLFTIIFFLDNLGIRSIVLYLVAGAILMLIVLTAFVGLKDVIPNLVGWLYLQQKRSIKEGQRIEVREISGEVEHIGYLETEIKTHKGDVLYVPNSLFLKSKHKMRKS